MQPLKIIALLIGGFPVATFLVTLILTNGAPLQSLASREESEPVAATRALPPAVLKRPPQERPETERHGRVAATGFQKVEERTNGAFGEEPPESAPLVDPDRHARFFMTLFGAPH